MEGGGSGGYRSHLCQTHPFDIKQLPPLFRAAAVRTTAAVHPQFALMQQLLSQHLLKCRGCRRAGTPSRGCWGCRCCNRGRTQAKSTLHATCPPHDLISKQPIQRPQALQTLCLDRQVLEATGGGCWPPHHQPSLPTSHHIKQQTTTNLRDYIQWLGSITRHVANSAGSRCSSHVYTQQLPSLEFLQVAAAVAAA
jgi:hypothetical protein